MVNVDTVHLSFVLYLIQQTSSISSLPPHFLFSDTTLSSASASARSAPASTVNMLWSITPTLAVKSVS